MGNKYLKRGLIIGALVLVWWWKDLQIDGLEKDVKIAERERDEAKAWAEYLQFNDTLTEDLLKDLQEKDAATEEAAQTSQEELKAELRELEQRLAATLKEAENQHDDPEIKKALDDADRIRQEHTHAVADRVAERVWSFYCEVQPDQADCAERSAAE
jgi:cysteinyl-tRNA synthetase